MPTEDDETQLNALSQNKARSLLGPFGPIVNLITLVTTFLRTGLAVATIIRHNNSRETMPFISPILWIDWATVFGIVGARFRLLGTLSAVVGVCLYLMCFWLTIGYGQLGYGVQQYIVLDIPPLCKTMNISWQTDPRRHHFVQLHSVIFASATVGVIASILNILGERKNLTWNFSLAFKLYHRPQRVIVYFKTIMILQVFISICVLAPVCVGVIMSGVLNGHRFLILGQQGCYASFVSGRFGYLDLYWVAWTVKIETWIGVNT